MAEWEEKHPSIELLLTHVQICKAKKEGTDGTNCFKLLSLWLMPDSSLIIPTLSSHTKQTRIPTSSTKAKLPSTFETDVGKGNQWRGEQMAGP